ncbi:MAG: hypothetical protein K2G44_04275 [Clostridia bacterium]|nr:hypothetical protein [Clostridia bacterium]MDE6676460.1 hypothetical protein [Clostridia bacterium]
MNCNSNSCLWILIILLILGTNVLSSNTFTGCGWPFLLALAYCFGKNGTLSNLMNRIGGCGCGCGCNG